MRSKLLPSGPHPSRSGADTGLKRRAGHHARAERLQQQNSTLSFGVKFYPGISFLTSKNCKDCTLRLPPYESLNKDWHLSSPRRSANRQPLSRLQAHDFFPSENNLGSPSIARDLCIPGAAEAHGSAVRPLQCVIRRLHRDWWLASSATQLSRQYKKGRDTLKPLRGWPPRRW